MAQHPDDNEFGAIEIAGDGDLDGGPAPPSPPRPPKKRPPAHRRTTTPRARPWLWLAGLPLLSAVAYAAFGFLLVPYLATKVVPARLGKQLDRPVTLAGASFNPFNLTLTLSNGIVGPLLSKPDDQVDPVLSFREIFLDLEAVSLLRQGLICREIKISEPFLHAVRNDDNQYNIIDIGRAIAGPLLYSFNNIVLTEGRILFDDLPAKKQHTAEQIAISMPSLSNMPYLAGDLTRPHFAAIINGSPLELTGETSTRDGGVQARFALNLTDMNVPLYASYLPLPTELTISKGSGQAALELIYHSTPAGDRRLTVSGSMTLNEILFAGRKGRESKTGLLRISGEFSPLEKTGRLQEVVLQGAELHAEQQAGGKWSLPLQGVAALLAGSQPADSAAWRISLERLELTGSRLDLHGGSAGGEPIDNWSDLQILLEPHTEKQRTGVSFSAVNRDRTRIAGQGSISWRPLQAGITLQLSNLNLPRLARYFNADTGIDIRQGTATRTELRLDLQPSAGTGKTAVLLRNAVAEINNLALQTAGRDVLSLKALKIDDGSLDQAGNINLGKLTGQDGTILTGWDKDGRSSWSKLLAASGEGGKTGTAAAAWRFSGLDLSGLSIELHSPTLQDDGPIILQNAALQLLKDTAPDQPGYTIKCNAAVSGGTVTASGKLDSALSAGSLDLRLADLGPAAAKRLFAEWLSAEVSGGRVQAAGELRLPEFSFTGSGALDALALQGAEPGQTLSMEKAAAEEIRLTRNPASLAIGRLTLTSPILHWPIAKTASPPFAGLFRRPPAAARSEQNSAPIIKEAAFAGGRLNITDTRLSTPYEAAISGITGSIASLGAGPGQPAKIALAGNFAGKAPMTATGVFTTDGAEQTVDLAIHAEGFPLQALPHLEAILGQKVSAGTATGETSYAIKGDQAAVSQDYRVRGLRLGVQIDKAGQAPLLAALLTGPEDTITIAAAESGKTGDAALSAYGCLTKQLRGRLLKITVSPFTLLPEFLPDPATADHLLFAAGSGAITDQHRKALDRLATLLKNRPGLFLQVNGSADGAKDRKALLTKKETERLKRELEAAARLSQQISAAYGKEGVKPGAPPSVQATPALPAPPPLPPAQVSDADLLELAGQRISAVRIYLIESAGLAKERISAGKPKLGSGQNRDESRIDFQLAAGSEKKAKP